MLPVPEALAVAAIDWLEIRPDDHSKGARTLMKRKVEKTS